MDPLGDESVERPSVKRTASPAVVDGAPLVGLPHDLLRNLFKYLDITDRLQLAYVSHLCSKCTDPEQAITYHRLEAARTALISLDLQDII